MSFFSRCLRYLSPAPFDSPAMEQQYAAHRTEDVRFRCLKHMLSYTLASLLLALSFRGLLASPSLSGWTFRIQLAAVLIAALIYGLMYAAHKQDGAASKLLREYNNAAQTIPAVYVCMVAPVLEPYRLQKLLGSSYAENVARWAQPLYDNGEWTSFVSSPRVKEVCGGWTPGEERACFFNSYEALVMTFIVYVVASAAVFGRTSPLWIFVTCHWCFAWYVFVRGSLGDVNSIYAIFYQDACILYLTLLMLYLSGRRVDQLLRAEFLHARKLREALQEAACVSNEARADLLGAMAAHPA